MYPVALNILLLY